jgi:hypothetical protein
MIEARQQEPAQERFRPGRPAHSTLHGLNELQREPRRDDRIGPAVIDDQLAPRCAKALLVVAAPATSGADNVTRQKAASRAIVQN